MAAGEQMLHIWHEWGLQVLVLLSFTLQVALLILAEFRRRFDSGILRAFVWSAYTLADGTAIYVLGHMSVTSRLSEHQLMAFWAPFLLLHLGGQDNITAYAMEDNTLWLRHLQALIVQVAAAAYVLYESPIVGSRSLLRPATVLMFVAGAVKFGERVWALWEAGRTPWGNKYMTWIWTVQIVSIPRGSQASVYIAHLLLDIARDLFKGPLPHSPSQYHWKFTEEEVYRAVEMQLSLMHDVLYTKAEVLHTWFGLCIRIISQLAVIGAFLLFHLWNRREEEEDSHSRVDVAVTYVLLVGAVVLEITSLLRAIFSSWTCYLLVKWKFEGRQSNGGKAWNLLAQVATSLYRLIHAAHWRRRYWSSSMGQHSLIQLCARSRGSRKSKLATWMGLENRWNTAYYSWSIPVSTCIEQLVVKQVVLKRDYSSHTRMTKTSVLYERIGSRAENTELEDIILAWHIATDIPRHHPQPGGRSAG